MVAGNQQAGKAGSCSGLPPQENKRLRCLGVLECNQVSRLMDREICFPAHGGICVDSESVLWVVGVRPGDVSVGFH